VDSQKEEPGCSPPGNNRSRIKKDSQLLSAVSFKTKKATIPIIIPTHTANAGGIRHAARKPATTSPKIIPPVQGDFSICPFIIVHSSHRVIVLCKYLSGTIRFLGDPIFRALFGPRLLVSIHQHALISAKHAGIRAKTGFLRRMKTQLIAQFRQVYFFREGWRMRIPRNEDMGS
jgi:Uncharacterized conserved protein, contains S4-like domain